MPRIAETYYAFTREQAGGNPAGVCIGETLPSADYMQQIATQLGYSETVFAAPCDDGFRVRYFAPSGEVAFCGHATLALGKALERRFEATSFTLQLNQDTVSVHCAGSRISLISPPAQARPLANGMLDTYLALCNLKSAQLCDTLPVAIAYAGNQHLALPLTTCAEVDAVEYQFEEAQRQMRKDELTTLVPFARPDSHTVYMRNLFASGNVYEDPATGSAAAALSGYLRDHNGTGCHHNQQRLTFFQGDVMGQPCTLFTTFTTSTNTPVTVSGDVMGPTAQLPLI